jgi:hypothetical protein
MKKQLTVLVLYLTLIGCDDMKNSEKTPRINIFEKANCNVYKSNLDTSPKNIPCPTGGIDPFWVYAAFHIPKFLPPKYAFSKEELLAASPKGIEFQQLMDIVKYQGVAAISDSSFHPEFNEDGILTAFSFQESNSHPREYFRITQDSNSLIHSIEGSIQKVVYEYDDTGMSNIKEYENAILVQQIEIR